MLLKQIKETLNGVPDLHISFHENVQAAAMVKKAKKGASFSNA